MSLLITGVSRNPALLDLYPNAAAAYSLRLLRLAYTGAVVRVRRSSDSTEQDFTAAQVTDGTLATFCGAGDGFVRTWYDQSGSGNNAIQATTSLQPQIVSNGSLIAQAGNPAINFLGGLCRLTSDGLLNRSFLDIYIVKNTLDVQHVLFSGGANQTSWIAESGSSSTFVSAAYGTGSLYANTALFTGTTRSQVYSHTNGYRLEVHQEARTLSANGWAFFDIGCDARTTSFDFVGSIQELIAFPFDQSANRNSIQSLVNTYYAIY
jgi:hypothetical protein